MRAEARRYSALMLAAQITLPHFSVLSAMSLPKSAGESASASPPRSASRASIWSESNPAPRDSRAPKWRHHQAVLLAQDAGGQIPAL